MKLALAKDTYATGVHGITGQELEEGWLAAGTLVRRVSVSDTLDGPVTRYEASTDNGGAWYKQITHDAIETEGGRR